MLSYYDGVMQSVLLGLRTHKYHEQVSEGVGALLWTPEEAEADSRRIWWRFDIDMAFILASIGYK